MMLSLSDPDSNVSPASNIMLKHNPDSLGADSLTRVYRALSDYLSAQCGQGHRDADTRPRPTPCCSRI